MSPTRCRRCRRWLCTSVCVQTLRLHAGTGPFQHPTVAGALQALQMLVLDEADKLLDMDFEKEIDQILTVVPRERRTLLFSATMTTKVQKLQRASLRSPVKASPSL